MMYSALSGSRDAQLISTRFSNTSLRCRTQSALGLAPVGEERNADPFLLSRAPTTLARFAPSRANSLGPVGGQGTRILSLLRRMYRIPWVKNSFTAFAAG